VTDLSAVIKAYDVRGVVPDQLDENLARGVGRAYVDVLLADVHGDRSALPRAVVIGHDMRPSSVPLSAALTEGITSQGMDVVQIGLCSTDELYFASGSMDLPGAMFTASHNPARYNGIKLCRSGARPVGAETGLSAIRTALESGVAGSAPAGTVPGSVEGTDQLPAYAAHLRSLVDLSGIRPLTVVVDAGNGMGGLTVPVVFDGLPLTVEPLYFELDGNFPNHEANPIDPANLADLQKAVLARGADLGLAFDGDADRCFVVDEAGRIVSPSTLTALIATRELARAPGSAVIHNLITSRAVPEIIRENGGIPVRTRVGHSFIKATMAEHDAVFGGEHSGHFYFRDFWFADSGMLAAMHVLAALGSQPGPLSALLARFSRYVDSGEINTEVADPAAVIARFRELYDGVDSVTLDSLDGLTVTADRWWFNLRPSNTEPRLRLNVEGADAATMASVRDEVRALISAQPGVPDPSAPGLTRPDSNVGAPS
jgi:phosphomannomutase